MSIPTAIIKFLRCRPCGGSCLDSFNACALLKVFSPDTRFIKRTNSMKVELIKKELEMRPFWKLKADLTNVSLELRSTADEEFSMTYSGHEDSLQLGYDLEKEIAFINNASTDSLKLSLRIPFKVDLGLTLGGCGDVKIENTEADFVEIVADNYDIKFGDLKCHRLNVATKKGDVISDKTLKGNVDIATLSGTVFLKKIQGNNISLKSSSVDISDVYAQKLSVQCDGKARIKSVHGISVIRSDGDIILGTGEGNISLHSKNGDICLHLPGNTSSVDVEAEKGDIEVSYSDDFTGEMEIEARNVVERKGRVRDLICEKDSPSSITLKAPQGSAILSNCTWFEAISKFDSSR